jgi:hypothetical protein
VRAMCSRVRWYVKAFVAAFGYHRPVRSGVVACLLVGCGFQPMASSTDGRAGDSGTVIDAKSILDTPAVTSSLAITVTTLGSTDLDVTAEGTIDWAHWGYLTATGFDRKAGGHAISNVTPSPSLNFTLAPFTATWSDGAAPHNNVSMTSSGVGIHEGSTLTFTVAADTTVRTLRLYVGAQTATGRLDVALDGSPTQTKMLTDATGTTNVCYAITFNAATAGQNLTISWSDTKDFGLNSFAALLEATLH